MQSETINKLTLVFSQFNLTLFAGNTVGGLTFIPPIHCRAIEISVLSVLRDPANSLSIKIDFAGSSFLNDTLAYGK